MFYEERAQVSFEYLLTAVFAIGLAVGSALLVESLRGIALDAQSQLLTKRATIIDSVLR